jgi:mono/diheme cytochrome c family protein
MKTLLKIFSTFIVVMMLAAALVWFLNTRDEASTDVVISNTASTPDPSQIERGAYLARAGNCAACHTARGGAAYAGGLGIGTPFGTVFTSNLTPDMQSGIGSWSPADFWRAMHNGRSKSGRLLYPAFPYTSYTQVTRDDSDALLAYLKSLPAVAQTNTAHAIDFPYNSQAALAVWRALFFSPGSYKAQANRSAEWNRGAYLVDGLGHCNACHAARNALGASDALNLAGGLIPVQNWYAPSLVSKLEAGVGDWPQHSIVSLLQVGVNERASVIGPMAEVVRGSTQYLSAADLNAMATFLKALPEDSGPKETDIAVMGRTTSSTPGAVSRLSVEQGAKLYDQHCAQCHGDKGQGVANAYPALAGNRAVVMTQTANLVQIVLNGGYAPATKGNPRPYGMPPFVLVLGDSDIAAVLTHIRSNWGNQGGPVSGLEVNRIRAGVGAGR